MITPTCLDHHLLGLMNVLATGGSIYSGFQNPREGLFSLISSTGSQRIADLTVLIDNLLLPSGHRILAQQAKDKLLLLVGGAGGPTFANSTMGHLFTWIDFGSGKLHFFPASQLAAYTDGIPNAEVLAGLTFLGLLGMAKNGISTGQQLCPTETDQDGHPIPPSDRCASMNSIFDAVLSGGLALLNSISQGLAVLESGLAALTAFLNLIISFLDQVAALIVAGLTALINTIVEAIRFSLAKFLEALHLDPCFKVLLDQIANAGLRTVLDSLPNPLH